MNIIDRMITENFDISDNYTRKYILSLDEAGQEELLASLSSALYLQIVNKVDDIDFGTIPKSRGDITKVDGYAGTIECLNTIRNLVIQYNQSTEIVDVVITSIGNIKERTGIFMKGFGMNAEMPMMMYNLIVLSIERSVSLMIATCIEFVKDPDTKTQKQALDKAAYKNTLNDTCFKQLISFNNLCANKMMDKILDGSMKPLKEAIEITASYSNIPHPQNNSDCIDCDLFGATDSSDVGIQLPKEVPSAVPNDVPDDEDFPEQHFGPNSDNVEPENIPTVTHDDGEPKSSINELDDDEVLDIDLRNDNNDDDIIDITIEDDPSADYLGPNPSIADDKETISEISVSDTLGGIGNAIVNLKNGGYYEKLKSILGNINISKKQLKQIAIIVAAISFIGLGGIQTVIGFLRNIVYKFYYTKMKFSDYLAIQSELLEANANDVENSTDGELSEDQKKKIAEKQRRWAEKLRKWSNMFNIDNKQSDNKAKAQADKDQKDRTKLQDSSNNSDDDTLF